MPQRLIHDTFEMMYFSAISGIVMHGISVSVEAAFVFVSLSSYDSLSVA